MNNPNNYKYFTYVKEIHIAGITLQLNKKYICEWGNCYDNIIKVYLETRSSAFYRLTREEFNQHFITTSKLRKQKLIKINQTQ